MADYQLQKLKYYSRFNLYIENIRGVNYDTKFSN